MKCVLRWRATVLIRPRESGERLSQSERACERERQRRLIKSERIRSFYILEPGVAIMNQAHVVSSNGAHATNNNALNVNGARSRRKAVVMIVPCRIEFEITSHT